MLEIIGKTLNGIVLGTKRNEIGDEILNNPGYFLEFDRKNKVQLEASLITISVLDRKEFSLNGKIINFRNFSKFIKIGRQIFFDRSSNLRLWIIKFNLF